ncbi:MAG: hypothetical protein F6K54_18385 [Okeania sp. SIO3B5]|uniref:hypothetical protein n=1 Tax=Okeania sp. SIO3B5 TaxID=2607811 RepID=UPI0013FFEAF8|nr:hypothetical protein [Okeania sp. SIO3B5]NEO54871.1 hypothetical protein [Okeania sp. SIO3B5]
MSFLRYSNFIHRWLKAIQNALGLNQSSQQDVEVSSPTWKNWCLNISYKAADDYYFTPKNKSELEKVIFLARNAG